MKKRLICGFALLATLAWSQQPTSTASMNVNKSSVERDGKIGFNVKVEPAPSTTSTVEVIVLPVAGGNGYKSICTVRSNENGCEVGIHIPGDAVPGTYKVAAVRVAPLAGTYKNLKFNSEEQTFEVTRGSVVLPESAQVQIKQ